MQKNHLNVRHDWQIKEIESLYSLPFNDLIFEAASIHRSFTNPNQIQLSKLLSIKTGACPEDCKYCSQSGHNHSGLPKEKLIEIEDVVASAYNAKAQGASRFCMGAAWRTPPQKDIPKLVKMIKEVKSLGLETCMTLGMLSEGQAQELANAGLDYYNHNLDTSPEYYEQVVTTRSYDDRLNTLTHVRNAGIKVCCGGILGMGESRADRISLLHELATLPQHPQSVPINVLVKISGTPFENVEELNPFELVRTVAVARILMPKTHIRLAAGRNKMNDQTQAFCFLAGTSSIFCGDQLLTTENPKRQKDEQLFEQLGLSTISCTTD